MIYFLMAYLIIVPIAFSLTVPLRSIQEIAFQMCSIVALSGLAIIETKKRKLDTFALPLVAMLVWMIFLFIREGFYGYSVLMNYFMGLGIFAVTTITLKQKSIKKIVYTLLGIVLFAVVYIALQYTGFDLFGQNTLNAPSIIPKCSFFGIEHAYGMYLAMVAPFMLVTGGWLGLFLIPAVIVSKSTGAMVGITCAVLFYLWFRKRILWWCFIVPLIISCFLYITLYDNPMGMQKTRIDMWGKVTTDSIQKFWGFGLDSFRGKKYAAYYRISDTDKTYRATQLPDGRSDINVPVHERDEFSKHWDEFNRIHARPPLEWWDHPHNETLLILYEQGIPGLFMFVWLLINIWNRFRYSKKGDWEVASMAALIALFISCQTQFPFHLARLGHLAPVLLGIFYVSTDYENTL